MLFVQSGGLPSPASSLRILGRPNDRRWSLDRRPPSGREVGINDRHRLDSLHCSRVWNDFPARLRRFSPLTPEERGTREKHGVVEGARGGEWAPRRSIHFGGGGTDERNESRYDIAARISDRWVRGALVGRPHCDLRSSDAQTPLPRSAAFHVKRRSSSEAAISKPLRQLLRLPASREGSSGAAFSQGGLIGSE
jgi:hypothetical protein